MTVRGMTFTQLLAFAALFLASSRTAAADPTSPTSTRFRLQARAKDVCQADCIGYSPSSGIWVCGIEESAGGMVVGSGTRCALQLLKKDTRIADLTVYVASETGMELADLTLPLERVSALLPDDLVRTTTIELPAGVEIKIPGVKHSVRADSADKGPLPTKNGRRGDLAAVTILCNSNRKEGNSQSVRALPPPAGQRPKPGDPKSVVIRSWPAKDCGQRVEYRLQVSSEPSQVALIERVHSGCVDFGIDRSTAQPVDLAEVCQDPPSEQRRR